MLNYNSEKEIKTVQHGKLNYIKLFCLYRIINKQYYLFKVVPLK